jgi:hypothetical protein
VQLEHLTCTHTSMHTYVHTYIHTHIQVHCAGGGGEQCLQEQLQWHACIALFTPITLHNRKVTAKYAVRERMASLMGAGRKEAFLAPGGKHNHHENLTISMRMNVHSQL